MRAPHLNPLVFFGDFSTACHCRDQLGGTCCNSLPHGYFTPPSVHSYNTLRGHPIPYSLSLLLINKHPRPPKSDQRAHPTVTPWFSSVIFQLRAIVGASWGALVAILFFMVI